MSRYQIKREATAKEIATREVSAPGIICIKCADWEAITLPAVCENCGH